jgi:hypothetical protein
MQIEGTSRNFPALFYLHINTIRKTHVVIKL